MTFTELELVLGGAFIALLYINNRLIREINARRAERDHLVDVMIGVAERRLKFVRIDNGIKVINLEKHNGETNQQT